MSTYPLIKTFSNVQLFFKAVQVWNFQNRLNGSPSSALRASDATAIGKLKVASSVPGLLNSLSVTTIPNTRTVRLAIVNALFTIGGPAAKTGLTSQGLIETDSVVLSAINTAVGSM